MLYDNLERTEDWWDHARRSNYILYKTMLYNTMYVDTETD